MITANFSESHVLTIEDKIMLFDGLYEEFSRQRSSGETHWFQEKGVDWKLHKTAFFFWLINSLQARENIEARLDDLEVANRKGLICHMDDEEMKKFTKGFTYKPPEECDHKYPSTWNGITPPHCKKCGKQAPSMVPTC